MTKVLVTESHLEDIADAIREKNGEETTYLPSEMATAISAIHTGTFGTKSISANGTYAASSDQLDGYSSVTVNVPNTYAAGDEGKVVSNGALVAQTARAQEITSNGTYDTTLNDEVTVDVSGGGGTSFDGVVMQLYAEYSPSTITSTGWTSTDGTMSLTTKSGTYAMVDGQLVGGTDVVYTIPVKYSYIAVKIRATLDNDFTPASSSNWYRQSCLFGCELSGQQKDYGVTLISYDSKIYPSIGYNDSSYARGTIPVEKGVEHEYALVVRVDMHMFLYVDGVLSVHVGATNTGTAISKLGILSNAENSTYTGVKGRVSSIKIYDAGWFDVVSGNA